VMDTRCANCTHWDSRDGLVGFCPEITDGLRLQLDLLVHGLAPCRTAASGRCLRFEASEEALDEAREAEQEQAAQRLGAGREYPRSLG